MRLVDLIAPIGKGTRGLIVSPPNGGKMTLPEQIGQGICAGAPHTRLAVLLRCCSKTSPCSTGQPGQLMVYLPMSCSRRSRWDRTI